jgi:hypothetical protein
MPMFYDKTTKLSCILMKLLRNYSLIVAVDHTKKVSKLSKYNFKLES